MNKLLAALMLTAGVFGAVAHADDVATGMRFADFANAEAGKTSRLNLIRLLRKKWGFRNQKIKCQCREIGRTRIHAKQQNE